MMSEKDFKRILARYLKGTANEQQVRWIEKWYASLESENNYPVPDEAEEQFLDRADLDKIQERINGKKRKKVVTLWPSLAAAAAAIIIGGVIFVYNLTTDRVSTVQEGTQLATVDKKIINGSPEIKVVKLPDSSKVSLHPNSTMWIAGDFNKGERKITLKGEAFFEVARDERQPFKVYTHEVVTTVLGTSFTIKAPSDKEEIRVAVRTGRVAVSSRARNRGSEQDKSQEVIVTPNQEAVFNPEKKELKATLVKDPVAVNKPAGTREVFDEAPIIHILRKIEDLYDVTISYDEQALAGCRITTAFLNEGLYERLDILSMAIGATYTVEGTTIIFKSNGCSINQ